MGIDPIRQPRAALWRRLLCLAAGLVAGAAQAATLTLAVADLPGFAPVLVAEAEGLFAAEGLDLKLLHCVNGSRCLRHLLDGQAQMATTAETPLVMAAHAGHRVDIVATFGLSREYRFVARADRGIRTMADLKGKRIGYIAGTSLQHFTDTLLRLHGVDPSQVILVPLAPGDDVERLARGEVDAAAFYQPHGHQAVQRLGAMAVQPAGTRAFAVMFNLVGQTVPSALPDETLVKVLRALRRACALLAEQPQRLQVRLAAQLKLEPALLQALWPDYEFRLTLEQPLLTMLESQSRWAVRSGVVSNAAMPDYLEMVRPGPLQSLDRRAVTLVK